MLDSLKAITEQRAHGDHWKVADDKIVKQHGKNHRLANLVDLVRSVTFAEQALANVQMSKQEAASIVKPLAEVSIKLQTSIEKRSFIERFIITIVQYIFTGTTLFKAINRFHDTVLKNQDTPNTFGAKIA